MSYTFLQLQTEFYSRGFDYLNDGGAGQTRAKNWINDAYLEICDEYEWPWLETGATGTGTVALSDLKTIALVIDNTNIQPLKFRDRRDLVENVDADLTTTGTPTYWYLTDSTNSTQTVNVYPANATVSLSVRYYKIPQFLNLDADEPLIPFRYQLAIVDGAVRRALLDNNDTVEAQAAEAERQVKITNMLNSQSARNAFEPDSMQSTQWAEL